MTPITRRPLLAALLATPFATWAQPARLDKFTVAGWSKPITEVLPLLVAEDKDFYKAQGIALEYVPGAGSADAIRNVLSGQADVAFADPGSFFAAIDKGEKLRAVYDIYPQNVFNVVSLKGSKIETPADLKGKKIGVYSLASGTRQALQVLLHTAGLAESDVTVVVTGLLNFAPLMPNRSHRRVVSSVGLPSAVPSQPSIGRMQNRLPTRTPSSSNGRASGDSADGASDSSKAMAAPQASRCVRNASAVFNDATRGYDGPLTRR